MTRQEQWAAERAQRTLDEIEAGKRAVLLNGKLEKVNEGTRTLRTAFPTLEIATVLNKPYDHVTMRVQPKVRLAPITDRAVLLAEEPTTYIAIELHDPIDEYPSDLLITKLALIA